MMNRVGGWPVRAMLDRLGTLFCPHYGIVVLVTLLGSGVYLLWPITHVGTLVFATGAALWLAQRLVPWTAIFTAGAFTTIVALHLRRQPYVDHVFHLAAMQLWIYALWYTLYADRLRSAKQHAFFSTATFPRWVFALSVFQVGLFYSLAGVAKLLDAGPAWADGLSLQLWVRLWGRPESALTAAISSSRSLAKALQIVVLTAEVGALFAAPSRWLRAIVGTLLIAFHVGQQLVFGWAFGPNLAIIALTYLPVFDWFAARYDGATCET